MTSSQVHPVQREPLFGAAFWSSLAGLICGYAQSHSPRTRANDRKMQT
jgi:hypothetical protein